MNKLLQTFTGKYLHEHSCSTHWGKWLGVGLLGCIMVLSASMCDWFAAKLSSTAAALFAFPSAMDESLNCAHNITC